MDVSSAFRILDESTLLAVRVTPRSSRDQIDGWAEDDAGRVYLKVRVRAVPENGAANESVCRLLASSLGLPKSTVSLHAGGTARVKQILIGAGNDEVRAGLVPG